MDWSLMIFSAFSTVAIVGSLMVILKKNPVSSAFSLVLVFFSFAGLYALVGAHLVAALQILVYTGAIMVLFVFVIMLLNQDEPVQDLKESSALFKGITALGVLGLVYVLISATLRSKNFIPTDHMTEEMVRANGGNLRVLSTLLFSSHLFHFELTSFLLLGAIVSTVALAKRRPVQGVSDD